MRNDKSDFGSIMKNWNKIAEGEIKLTKTEFDQSNESDYGDLVEQLKQQQQQVRANQPVDKSAYTKSDYDDLIDMAVHETKTVVNPEAIKKMIVAADKADELVGLLKDLKKYQVFVDSSPGTSGIIKMLANVVKSLDGMVDDYKRFTNGKGR